MKRVCNNAIVRFAFVFLLSSMSIFSWAQDTTVSSNKKVTTTETSTTTTEWYTQPWVWIVGGAVFIIILVALLRSNSKDKTEVSRSTTVIKDRT